MHIDGLKSLEKKLASMDKKVAKSAVRKAVRQAQNLCLSATKQNAVNIIKGEMGTKISSALKVKAIYKQKRGSYQLQVAIDPAKAEEFKHTTKSGETYYIPTAIEYGHKNQNGGTVPPISYMRTAAEQTEKARIEKVFSELKKAIQF